MKLLKVFYAEDDEHEIISTLFYIHKDLDACLIRTAEDISNTIDQTPCIKKVRLQHSKTEICSILWDAFKLTLIGKSW